MLTVKDFIIYNNPCFFCRKPVDLLIRSVNVDDNRSTRIKNLNLDPEFLEVDLKITYSSILNLKINHTHNHFISNDLKDLTTYLKKYKISLMLQCSSCGTTIKSEIMQFDFDKQIIKPLKISSEILHVWDNGTFYSISTNMSENKSILTATTGSSSESRKPGSTVLKLPLQPLKKFKTPELLLKKMKTLLLFA